MSGETIKFEKLEICRRNRCTQENNVKKRYIWKNGGKKRQNYKIIGEKLSKLKKRHAKPLNQRKNYEKQR